MARKRNASVLDETGDEKYLSGMCQDKSGKPVFRVLLENGQKPQWRHIPSISAPGGVVCACTNICCFEINSMRLVVIKLTDDVLTVPRGLRTTDVGYDSVEMRLQTLLET